MEIRRLPSRNQAIVICIIALFIPIGFYLDSREEQEKQQRQTEIAALRNFVDPAAAQAEKEWREANDEDRIRRVEEMRAEVPHILERDKINWEEKCLRAPKVRENPIEMPDLE